MTLYCPPFVTETDEALWTDCTWSSGLMLANKATITEARKAGKYPSTRPEREALRAASGDRTGGSSIYDLALGIRHRYGWALSTVAPTWPVLLSRLERGDGAVVAGLYSRLPAHHQRWDRAFAAKGPRSTHAMYVQATDRGQNIHLDAAGNLVDVFLCDPLGRGDYRGEWLPVGGLRAFLTGLGSIHAATVRQGQVP